MNDVAEKLESILATASEMLIAEGMTSVAEILRTSTPRLEETGYDNWNGGTTIWTIYLLLEPSAYAQIQEKQRNKPHRQSLLKKAQNVHESHPVSGGTFPSGISESVWHRKTMRSGP